MNKKNDAKTLLVGLDIGTSKIVAIVGEHAAGEPVEVIGIGSHPTKGLKRGVASLCIGGGEATANAVELV